jgi:hypothetical protein
MELMEWPRQLRPLSGQDPTTAMQINDALHPCLSAVVEHPSADSLIFPLDILPSHFSLSLGPLLNADACNRLLSVKNLPGLPTHHNASARGPGSACYAASVRCLIHRQVTVVLFNGTMHGQATEWCRPSSFRGREAKVLGGQ